MRLRIRLIVAVVMVCGLAAPAFSQERAIAAVRRYRDETTPQNLRAQVNALGERLKAPGKERVVLSGTVQVGAVTGPATLAIELPGQVRLEVTRGGRNRAIAFDLEQARGRDAIDDDDEDFLETLGLDTTEQFLFQIEQGAALRLIGHHFRIQDETGFGSLVDIFTLPTAMQSRRDKDVRTKTYMFDVPTGLLRRVSYRILKGGVATTVETVLSNYSVVDGHQLPGVIVRRENRREVFRFQRTAAAISAKGNDAAFRLP